MNVVGECESQVQVATHNSTLPPTMERPAKKLKTKTVSIKAPASAKDTASSARKPTAKKKTEQGTTRPKHVLSSSKDRASVKPLVKENLLDSTARSPQRLVVVSGSYDKILYGLQIEPKGENTNEDPQFKPVFVFPAHISCVKAVAASPQGGKWLASGGTDEIIKVWDLRRKKELGSLQQHQGSFIAVF